MHRMGVFCFIAHQFAIIKYARACSSDDPNIEASCKWSSEELNIEFFKLVSPYLAIR